MFSKGREKNQSDKARQTTEKSLLPFPLSRIPQGNYSGYLPTASFTGTQHATKVEREGSQKGAFLPRCIGNLPNDSSSLLFLPPFASTCNMPINLIPPLSIPTCRSKGGRGSTLFSSFFGGGKTGANDGIEEGNNAWDNFE